MKKIITGIMALVLLTASATFANTPDNKNGVAEKVQTSFKKEFSKAENITWSKVNELYRAQFVLNGHVVFAFLNEDGEVVSAYRNILSTQLPLQLLSQIKQDYSDYWINELVELTKDKETSYYVSLENGNDQIVLKSENGINWTVHSKIKK